MEKEQLRRVAGNVRLGRNEDTVTVFRATNRPLRLSIERRGGLKLRTFGAENTLCPSVGIFLILRAWFPLSLYLFRHVAAKHAWAVAKRKQQRMKKVKKEHDLEEENSEMWIMVHIENSDKINVMENA